MSIRTIKYTVTESGITPTTVQDGGVQGDHNATELEFTLPSDFVTAIETAIETAANGAKVYYRFDGYSGSGLCKSTDPKELDGTTLSYPLEEWITRDGGNVQVLLVITAVSGDTTELELYSFPALIKLKNRPRGKSYDGNSHESITTLAEAAKDAAKSASSAAGKAMEYESLSATHSANASASADGAFGALQELENKIASGDYTGEKGDKGDKGDPGKDAVTDQTFDPTSENAQSGKAIAPVFANALKGSASGEKAVAVNDVSPIGHNLTVKTKKRNLLPPSIYQNITSDNENIKVSVNSNGTIDYEFSNSAIDLLEFEPLLISKGTYTISGAYFVIYDINGNYITASGDGIKTFALGVDTEIVINMHINSPNNTLESATGTISPMLVQGAFSSLTYSPYVDDLSDVTISRYGKNWFGLTANDFNNGKDYNPQVKQVDLYLLPNTTYTLSSDAQGSTYNADIWVNGGISQDNGVYQGQSRTVTTDANGWMFVLVRKVKINDIFRENYIQLELGSKATAYEPIKPMSAVADAEGNVEGLTSVSPNMTLVSDTEGVTINLEYNRDINKAFAELQQAILNNI